MILKGEPIVAELFFPGNAYHFVDNNGTIHVPLEEIVKIQFFCEQMQQNFRCIRIVYICIYILLDQINHIVTF